MYESTLFNHHEQSQMQQVFHNPARFFWSWFQDNANYLQEILFTKTAINEFTYWLQINLDYYCKGLGFKIAMANKTNPKHQIWFSCNGNPAYFKAVTNLVDSSPRLEQWLFSAFVPKSLQPEDFYKKHQEEYFCNNIYIRLSHVYLKIKAITLKQSKLKLDIYIKNYEYHQDKKALEKQVYRMFQDYLGEISLFKTIHSAKFYPYPKRLAINKSGLLPLYKLPEAYEVLVC